jgi:hypothetical protein
MWFSAPRTKKPLLVSSRTKLAGDAANGDIAAARYARDYRGKIVREEKAGDEEAWVLELEAVAKEATYDRIRYWVSKRRRLGLKAELLSVQGDVLKTATFEYGHSLQVGGKPAPFISRMEIRDPLAAGSVTTLTYQPPRPEQHPDELFDVARLVRN